MPDFPDHSLQRFTDALDWDFLALYDLHGRDAGGLFEEDLPVNWTVVFHPQMATLLARPPPARLPFLLRVIQAGGMALSHVLRVAKETGHTLDLGSSIDLKEEKPWFHSLDLSSSRPITSMTPLEWAIALVPDNGEKEFLDEAGRRVAWKEDCRESQGYREELTRLGLTALSSIQVLLEEGVPVTPGEGKMVAGKTMHLWHMMDSHGVDWPATNHDPVGIALRHVSEPWLSLRARYLVKRGWSIEGTSGGWGGFSPLLSNLAGRMEFNHSELRALLNMGANPHVRAKGAVGEILVSEQNAWHLVIGPFALNNRPGQVNDWAMYQLALKFIWLTLHKVDPNVADSHGKTVWHMLAAHRLPMVFGRILERAGARVDGIDHEGKTPLDIARENGATELEWFLLEKKALRDRDDFRASLPGAVGQRLISSGVRL